MPPRKKTPAPKKASLTDPYLHTRLDRDQMRRVKQLALDEDLQPDAARHSGLGRNPQKPKTAAAINQQGTKVETKTQTVAVEMTYDKATKNKYVFAAPTGSAVEPIYVSKLPYAAQPKKVRVTIEVLE